MPVPFRSVTAAALASTALSAVGAFAQVVPDGRTGTSVGGTGGVTDISTTTISGGFGVNSFATFTTASGSIVNIHAPSGTQGTVNLVTAGPAEIGGTVTGILDGAAGGGLYIASSHGVVVGPDGAIHAGTVGLSAPSQAFMDGFFDPAGKPLASHVTQIVEGTAPGSAGRIDIAGRVTGRERVVIRTAGDVVLRPGAHVSAGHGGQGGLVDIRPGRDIDVWGGAVMLAEGEGAGSGGVVYVFADGSARLRRDAVISAAARGAGDGGFVEFSAIENVLVEGILVAHSEGGGKHGRVLIDPATVTIATSQNTFGAAYEVIGIDNIVIAAGVTINTRAAAGGAGDITLTGPNITLEAGVSLLADDTSAGGTAHGTITLTAIDPLDSGVPLNDSRSITITDAILRGGAINLVSTLNRSSAVTSTATRTDYINTLLTSGVQSTINLIVNNLIAAGTGAAVNLMQDAGYAAFASSSDVTITLTRADIDARTTVAIAATSTAQVNFTGVRVGLGAATARSTVRITDSELRGRNGVTAVSVTAHAETHVDIAAGDFTYGQQDTHALVVVEGSTLNASTRGGVALRAETIETTTLSGQGPVTGVFSRRDQSARVLVDASPGEDYPNSDGSYVFGGLFTIDALSTRTTSLAGTGGGSGIAGAIVRSDATGNTEAVFAAVSNARETVFDARAVLSYTAVANGTGGASAAATPPVGTAQPGFDPAAWAASAAEAAAAGATATGAPAGGLASASVLGLVHLSENHSERTRAIVGKSVFDGEVYTFVNANDGGILLRSNTRLDTFRKTATLRMEDSGNALAANLVYGNWLLDTATLMETESGVFAEGSLILSAANVLPADAASAFDDVRDEIDDIGLKVATDQAATLEAADLMPSAADYFGAGDFSITSESMATGAVGLLVDAGRHSFDLAARAEIGAGVRELGAYGQILVSASNSGNILQRRLAPVAPTAGSVALGGTRHRLEIAPSARARIGLAGDFLSSEGFGGGITAGGIRVAAENEIAAALFTAAFGGDSALALSGAMARIDYDGLAQATIDANQEFFVTNAIDIAAADSSTLIAGAGVGYSAGTVGAGAGHALIVAARDVLAGLADLTPGLIGSAPADLGFDPDDFGFGVGYVDTEELRVEAENRGYDLVTAAAGAASSGATPEIGGDAPGGADLSGVGDAALGALSSGVAISADYAGLRQDNRTRAIVETNAPIFAKSIFVKATDAQEALLASGAAVAGAGAAGLGGSLASYKLDSETRARITGPGGLWARDFDGDLSTLVSASTTGKARVLSAGRAGPGFAIDAMGSVARVEIDSVVEALIDRDQSEWDTVDAGLGLSTLAESARSVWAIAGAVTGGEADKSAGGSGDEDQPGKGSSVGAAVTRLFVTEEVTAENRRLNLRAGSPDFTVNTLAVSNADLVGAALSLGSATGFSVLHSDVRFVTEQTTRAAMRDVAGIIGPMLVDVQAADGSVLRARIGAETDGRELGWGSSEAMIDDTRVTEALFLGGGLAPAVLAPAPSLRLAAANTVTVDIFQRAGGGDKEGNYTAGFSRGILRATWGTRAEAGDLELSLGELEISAREKAEVTNRQAGGQEAEKGAGAVGVVTSTIASDVAATLSDSVVSAFGGAVMSAKSLSSMRARAVLTGDVDEGWSVQAVAASQKRSGDTRVELSDTTLAFTPLSLAALDTTWRETVANAAVEADRLGGAGAVVSDKYTHNTRATISGGSVTGPALGISAISDTRATGLSLARAKPGAKSSFTGQVVWIKDDRDVVSSSEGTALDIAGALDVTAERLDVTLILTTTEAGGRDGAALGLDMFYTGGATEARVVAPALAVGGDVTIAAADASSVVAIALGTGSSSRFSGVGSVAVLNMGRIEGDDIRLEEDDRGGAVRDLAETTADGVADETGDLAGLDDPASRSARQQTIRAILEVGGGAEATIGGNLTVAAFDARVATVTAGQLQAGFLSTISGVADQLTDVVDVRSISASGIDIQVWKIGLTTDRDDAVVFFDTRRREGWDFDEKSPEMEVEFGPPTPPSISSIAEARSLVRGARDKVREIRALDWDGGLDGTEPGTPKGGSEDLEDAASDVEGAEPDLDTDTGTGLGVAIGWAQFGGLVEARVTLQADADLAVSGRADILANSAPRSSVFSAGAQVSSGTAIGAGGAITWHRQVTRARIDGAGTLSATRVTLDAGTEGEATTFAGLVTVAGIGPGATKSAAGATIAVGRLDAATEAVIDGSQVDVTGGALKVLASEESAAGTLAVGGGGSVAGNYFGGSVAYTAARATASARAVGATLSAVGDVHVEATRDQELVANTIQAGISGGSATGTGALSIVRMLGATEARLVDSEVESGDDVIVLASSNAGLGSSAVSAALSIGAAVSGSASISKREDAVDAVIDGGTVLAADSVLVQAASGGVLDAFGGGGDNDLLSALENDPVNLNFGGKAGVGVSLSIVESSVTVNAALARGARVTSLGTPANDGVEAIARAAGSDYRTRTTATRHGIAVIADNETELRTLALTLGGGGVASVQGQFPILIVRDTVTARVWVREGLDRLTLDAARDVRVEAANVTDLRTFAMTGSVGGKTAVGADIEYLELAKTTLALVDRTDITARDITVRAAAPESVSTLSISGALGGFAGIGGIVQVVRTTGETAALVTGSTLAASRNLSILAAAPKIVNQDAGNIAAGLGGGVGGTIVVFNAEDTVLAEITDSPTALANAFTTELDVAGDVAIEATADFEHDAVVVGLGGGATVGINASILVTQFRQNVRAWMGDHARMEPGRATSLTIAATQSFRQTALVGGLSGGGVAGIGASVGALSMRNSVAAGIGADAQVDVTGDVSVTATSHREFEGLAAALGGGGGLALQAAVLVVTYGKPSEVDEPRQAFDRVSGDMSSDPYQSDGAAFDGGDADVALALSAARAGRAATDVGALTRLAGMPEDSITAEIGARAQIIAGGAITIGTHETGEISAASGAIAGAGGVAAAGGVTVVNRGSTLRSLLGASARLDGASVRIDAVADVDQDPDVEPTSIAGAGGGLFGGAGAFTVSTTARTMEVGIGQEVQIVTPDTGRIDVVLEERGGTRANSLAAAFSGFLGVGGTWAAAHHDSNLAISFSDAVRPRIEGGTVDIRITRSGEVKSWSTAAAGGLTVAIAGSLAESRDTARATIDLGSLVVNNGPLGNPAAQRNTTIAVRNGSSVTATSNGVAIAGFGSGGASVADARRDARAEIRSAAAQFITRDLTVEALDSTSRDAISLVRARSVTVAGSLIASVTAGVAFSENTSTAVIYLGLSGLSSVAGNVTLTSSSRGLVDSRSTGVTAGAIAIGANQSATKSLTQALLTLDLSAAALIVGSNLTVESLVVDNAANRAISGTGGLGVVQAANAEVTNSAVVDVTLTGATAMIGGDATIRAERETDISNEADSFAASAVGFGGTNLHTDILGFVDVTIDLTMTAASFDIAARNTVARPEDGFTGWLGDVGLYSGMSLKAYAEVYAELGILFTENAVLTQTDAGKAITVRLEEDYDVDEALKIDTGGAIRRPHADTKLVGRTRRADVIFDGATLEAEGSITVENAAKVDLYGATVINVGGAAGAPRGFSDVSYTENRLTELRDGTVLQSRRGTVELGAGARFNSVAVEAETRIWNGVAFGSGFRDTDTTIWVENAQGQWEEVTVERNIDAAARLDQSAIVNIAAGAEVRAGTDVIITASRGASNAYAYGAGSSAWQDLTGLGANFVRSLVGLDEVSVDFITGRSTASGRADAVIDGAVTAGAFFEQLLQINRAGEIIRNIGDDIEVTFVENADIGALVDDYIAAVEAEPEGDAEFETVRAFELIRLAILRDAMSAHDDVTVIVIEDLFAAGGNVLIDAEVLRGAGDITANGDARIEVFSDAAAIIDFRSALIPFEAGGDIRLNGISVLSNAKIQEINDAGSISLLSLVPPVFGPDPDARAQFTLSRAAADGPRPVIRVHNTYVGLDGWSGDLFVTGTVENLRGTVELATADGNILVLGGDIKAGAIDIFSGGDFFLGASIGQPLVNLGADPLGGPPTGLYGDFFAEMGEFLRGNRVVPPDFEYREADGQLRAGGNIYVYANNININGLVQAGITDWALDIAFGIEALIDAASLLPIDEGGLSTTEETVLFSRGYAIDAVNPNLPGFVDRVPGITGNGIVRWDPVARVLRIDPMITRGGYVEIVGRIVSTGGGRIEAAHGFGQINITNDSTLPIVLSELSTGSGDGAEGLVRIVDTSKPIGDGFLVTTYRKREDGQVEASFTTSGQLLGTSSSGLALPIVTAWIPQGTEASYDVVANSAIRYGTGETETWLTATIERRLFNLVTGGFIGPNVEAQSTTSSISALDTVEIALDPAASLQGYAPSIDFTARLVDSETVGAWVRVNDEALQASLGTPDLEWQDRLILLVERQRDHIFHTLKADFPIAIGFSGYESGEINVESRGTVSLTGSVVNRSGPTIIRAVNPAAGADPTASIFMRRDPILNVARLRLEADNHIVGGAPGQDVALNTTPILIDQAPGRGLELRAGGDIRVESMGNMVLREVVSSRTVPGIASAVRGDVTLRAAGSILLSANAVEGAVVEGSDITLVARSGTIGTEETPLRIGATGILTARAGFDIDIASPIQSITIDRVESQAGDVRLASGGSIRDGNAEILEDRRARDGLLEFLWDSIGLRDTATLADGTPNTREEDAVARLEATRTRDYQDYWALRGDGAYDPALAVAFDAEEIAAFEGQGLSGEDIAALAEGLTARFHESHARFGAGSFDAGFSYVATAAEVAEIGGAVFLSDTFLGLGLRADLVLEVADTQVVVEAPNIIARDITLSADGSIGNEVETAPITRGSALTEDLLLRLWTAERADFRFIDDDTLIVRGIEDVDVIARGKLEATAGQLVAGQLLGGDIFLGSPEALIIRQVVGLRDIRVKAAGGLLPDTPPGTTIGVVGRHIVLEGGRGGIGAFDTALQIVQGPEGSFVARANDEIAVVVYSDLAISEVFSGTGVVTIVAPFHSIRDFNNDPDADIIARQIMLVAGSMLGEPTNKLDIDLRGPVRLITAGSIEGGTFLNVVGGDAVALAVGSVQAETHLEVSEGDLLLLGTPGQPALNAGTDLVLTVAGAVLGKPGLEADIVASGAVQLNLAGDFGSLAQPIIAAFENTAFDQTPRLSALRLGGSGAPQVFIANRGELELGLIALGTEGSRFSLLNQGRLNLPDMPLFVASNVQLGTLNPEGDTAPIRILGSVAHVGDSIAFQTASALTIGAEGSLSSTGDIAMTAPFIRWLGGGSGGTLEAGGDITLSATEVVGITLAGISAAGILDVTAEGFAALGEVAARTAEVRALSVTGVFTVEESLELDAGLVLGGFEDEAGFGDPLVIRARPDLDNVRLTGDYGVNVRVEGTAERFAQSVHSVRTQTVANGLVRRTDGTTVPVGDVLPGGDALVSAGIRLSGNAYLSIAGDGITAQGAPITVDTGRLTQLAGAHITSGGGDITLRDRGFTVPMTLGAMVDSGAGDIVIAAESGLQASAAIQSFGGDVTISTDFTALIDPEPVRLSNIFTMGGDLTITIADGTDLDTGLSVLNSGAGRLWVTVGGDATIEGRLLSSYDDGDPAILLEVAGLLVTDQGVPQLQTVLQNVEGLVRVRAGSLGATASLPLFTGVGLLDIAVEDGAIHLLNNRDLRLFAVESRDGSLIDIFVEGDMTGAGPVISEGSEGNRGDIVLTARGSIGGFFTQVSGRFVQFTALEGTIGFSPLIVRSLDVTRMRVFGREGVELRVEGGGLDALWVLSNGPVNIAAEGPVGIALLGTPDTPEIAATTVSILAHGAAAPVDTLPPAPGGVINPSSYPLFAALGPGYTGGGDTGGGDTGGGDTGGGDTGGGDSGGGDTGGGDTGGGDTSGGDTGGGDTGGGDTGGGDTGGGDTGGGDTGGGDTGGGDTGGDTGSGPGGGSGFLGGAPDTGAGVPPVQTGRSLLRQFFAAGGTTTGQTLGQFLSSRAGQGASLRPRAGVFGIGASAAPVREEEDS